MNISTLLHKSGLAALIFLSAQAGWSASAGGPPILCVGDSLTFGVGGEGTTYPSVLAARTGVPTVNLGLSGFIPRHILYHVFLHELPWLSRAQLESVPPVEYEDRKNQPEINHLRTFLTPGQTVWVQTAGVATQYAWDPAADHDDGETVKPAAVGDASHHPLIAAGRWRRVAAPRESCPGPKAYRGVVFCVGANGMEPDDILRSLRILLPALVPRNGNFLILGLINRVDPDKHPEAIAHWARCIAACNAALRAAYPDNFLDLQPRFAVPVTEAQPGGYRTRDWFAKATTAQVARDQADQARGVLPFSLRYPDNSTHLNATGYTLIGQLAADWVQRHGWLESPGIPERGQRHGVTRAGACIHPRVWHVNRSCSLTVHDCFGRLGTCPLKLVTFHGGVPDSTLGWSAQLPVESRRPLVNPPSKKQTATTKKC